MQCQWRQQHQAKQIHGDICVVHLEGAGHLKNAKRGSVKKRERVGNREKSLISIKSETNKSKRKTAFVVMSVGLFNRLTGCLCHISIEIKSK